MSSAYENHNEIIGLINSISQEIALNGNIKNRGLDLEDLLVIFLKRIKYDDLKESAQEIFSEIQILPETLKFVNSSLMQSYYNEISGDPNSFKKIANAIRSQI